MRRTLVTGASGFVGPHVVQALVAAGHEVWATDLTPTLRAAGPASRSMTPTPQALAPASPAATDAVTARTMLRYEACDLTSPGTVQALVSTAQPTGIVHLASVSSVKRSFDEPQQTLRNNLLAACNVLEAVRRSAPRARVLLIGSAEQYGIVGPQDLPLVESQPFRPASPYAVAKVAQEYLGWQYNLAHGLDVVATRSFNHSGPGQRDDFVLPSFARQIAAAELGQCEPVLHVGNLDAERDFLDVRDVARAYVLLLERGHAGVAYNICRGRAFRVHDLLQGLVRRSRVAVSLLTDPERMRPADLPVLLGNPERLRAHTGWEPLIDIDALLTAVLDDWRARLRQAPEPST